MGGPAERTRRALLDVAQVISVDNTNQTATIAYLDSPGSDTPGIALPTTAAGSGWGISSGIQKDAYVLVGHGVQSKPYILGVIPPRAFFSDAVFETTENASILKQNVAEAPGPGVISAQSSDNSRLILDRAATLAASSEDYIKVDGSTRSFVVSSEQAYIHTASFDERSGTTKRDINRVRKGDDDLYINQYTSEELDTILEPVGKVMFEDG
jgi:hypothetical protein